MSIEEMEVIGIDFPEELTDPPHGLLERRTLYAENENYWFFATVDLMHDNRKGVDHAVQDAIAPVYEVSHELKEWKEIKKSK